MIMSKTSEAQREMAGMQIMERLACPICSGHLSNCEKGLSCDVCARIYPVKDGVMDLRPPKANKKLEAHDWSEHWDGSKQETLAQRFFSMYRKAVFARTVRYFTSRYFPSSGVLVEAGCGTAETSMLIDKRDGNRTLVAMDLIPQVLTQSHPIMDIHVSGDIFQMPFQEGSVGGIWNVGVMEHFTHPQIDAILTDFHRVLQPGGRVILLWPAIFSVPQRILRVLEWFVHRTSSDKTFRFHPPEISQVRSIRHGREILERNGFKTVTIDPGLYSLMAFETLVGEKAPPTV